jgi:hypothetical protein
MQGCRYRDVTVLASVTQDARDDALGVILWEGDIPALGGLQIGASAHRARLGFQARAFFHRLEVSRRTYMQNCAIVLTLQTLGTWALSKRHFLVAGGNCPSQRVKW